MCLFRAGPAQSVSGVIFAMHVQSKLVKTMVKMAEAVKLPKAASSIVRYDTLPYTHMGYTRTCQRTSNRDIERASSNVKSVLQ